MVEEYTGDGGTARGMPLPRSFEELFSELEQTVRELEEGDLSLSNALSLFERSTALAEQCNALLDRAELRVRQLIQGPDGSLDTQPFES